MIQRLFILALLIGAAVGSAWLLQNLSAVSETDSNVKYHDPDYYLEDFTTVTMEDDGTPKHKLYAVYMAHYPDDDTSELLKPKMEIFRNDKLPVYIEAEKGWVTAGNEVIFLQGDVKMWEYDIEGNYVMQVDTSEVRVLLNDEYAETDKYATITTNSSIITGTGMRAFLPDSRLEVINHDKTTIKSKPNS